MDRKTLVALLAGNASEATLRPFAGLFEPPKRGFGLVLQQH
jgi:hypothetical protein